MQDVTADICTNTPEADTAGNHQYQLKDSRDQKTYWVAKLKDGNCWMTQSLRLDLYDVTLTSVDSDVKVDWKSTTGRPAKYNQNAVGYNYVGYYDPGARWCGGDLNVSSSDCPVIRDGDDEHYLIGYNYSWAAATAGQAASLVGNNVIITVYATQSICPRGWKLPATRGDLNGSPMIVNTLLSLYGFDGVDGAIKGNIDGKTYSIVEAPFYFTNGYFWSSTGRTYPDGYQAPAYALSINYSIDSFSLASMDRNSPDYVRCVSDPENIVEGDNVDVEVNPTISMDVADEVTVEKNETNPSIANLDVKVSSNQKYSVGISASDSNLTSTTNNVIIPAKSGLLNTVENGWGIKLRNDTEFTALTSNLQTFYTASGAEIKTIPFTIGISTASDIPNGEYSTNITITATQN